MDSSPCAKEFIILESSKVNRREEEAFEEEFAAAVVDDLVSSVITEAQRSVTFVGESKELSRWILKNVFGSNLTCEHSRKDANEVSQG